LPAGFTLYNIQNPGTIFLVASLN
jgi:hypothetical protein